MVSITTSSLHSRQNPFQSLPSKAMEPPNTPSLTT